jgi:RsiW-degrading membrane proteinase PrsW (M82 family)
MTTPAPRSPTRRTTTVLLAVIAALPATAWFVDLIADVPGPIVGAAALPALVFAWLVTRLDRDEPEPPLALAGSLVGGAVLAAAASHTVNGWLLAWANDLAGADAGRSLAGRFGAPVVEEVAKAAAVVLVVAAAGRTLQGALDGIVYGALVGMGFAFTENVVYLTFAVLQGGSGGLARGLWVRALLGGWNHAAFTATTGAALGWAGGTGAALRRRWLVAAVGLALAVVQHVAWNAVAADAINDVLCDPTLAGGPCRPIPSRTSLFVLVPLLTVAFVGPALVTLGAIAVLARARAARRRAVF